MTTMIVVTASGYDKWCDFGDSLKKTFASCRLQRVENMLVVICVVSTLCGLRK